MTCVYLSWLGSVVTRIPHNPGAYVSDVSVPDEQFTGLHHRRFRYFGVTLESSWWRRPDFGIDWSLS